jgi:hypothetical protein
VRLLFDVIELMDLRFDDLVLLWWWSNWLGDESLLAVVLLQHLSLLFLQVQVNTARMRHF